MGALTVQPWNRYGKSRLYVNDTDGTRVGWHDLATGVSTIERSERADDFVAALRPYLTQAPAVASDAPEPSSPSPEVPPVAPSGVDLAARRAGEGLREQADAAWQARKDRSKLLAYAGRALDVHTDERAWRRGAEGEESIGSMLEKLSSRGWLTLHSVPVGTRGSDIDHVVIGPGGVFTINTKNHLGKRVSVSARGIWVTGHWQPYIRNAEHEATRASRFLSEACGLPVIVRGVVAVLCSEFQRKAQPADVIVLQSKELYGWLKKRPEVLDADTVGRVYEQARRGEIWSR